MQVILFALMITVRPSLRGFSQTSPMLNRIMCRPLSEYHPKLTIYMGSMIEIDLRPSVKYGFHCGPRERIELN